MHSRATDGMSASECQGNRPDQAVKHRSDVGNVGSHPPSRIWASSRFRNATIHVSSGFIWGIPVYMTAPEAKRSDGSGFARIWIPLLEFGSLNAHFVALSLARPPDPYGQTLFMGCSNDRRAEMATAATTAAVA